MKGIKTVAANLANRINQQHHLETVLKKVYEAGKRDARNVIPFVGEWKLYENIKPNGYFDLLCILENNAVVVLNYSDTIKDNNGFFHVSNGYSFEANPVIYWDYLPKGVL